MFPLYLVAKIHLNHCKASILFFSSFNYFGSFFYYRSSSWRLYMVVRQGFVSFFNCSSRFLSESRSVKLYSKKTWCSTHVLFCGVQPFFFLHSEVQFVLPYHLRWCYVILDHLSSCFMFHMLSRMRYVKSTNLFVGVILCHVSPKAYPKECC